MPLPTNHLHKPLKNRSDGAIFPCPQGAARMWGGRNSRRFIGVGISEWGILYLFVSIYHYPSVFVTLQHVPFTSEGDSFDYTWVPWSSHGMTIKKNTLITND